MKNKTPLQIILLICLFSMSNQILFSQTKPSPEAIKMVQKIVDGYTLHHHFSGNILIGSGDKVIFQNSSGMANYEHNIPNKPDTKFRLASLSKQFTATALLLLEQEGKVDFNSPISNYLTNLNPKIANKITLHQVLSHSSGLGRDIESLSDKELGQNFISLNDIVTLISNSELVFEPGEKWSYSNLGYALAAAVIEKVTKLSYGEALEKLIFEPLKMKNTGHEISSKLNENRANGYVELPDGIVNAFHEDKSYVIGAGSIYSTTEDLFIWTRELLTGTMLISKNKKRLFSKQVKRYSYGWFIDTYVWPPVNDENQALNPHHDGGSPGFESNLSILTNHDLVIIILSNKLPSNLNRLNNQITNVCVGFDDEKPPKPNGSQELFECLFNNGIDATLSLIKSWKTPESKHLIPKGSEMLLIGRGYMDSQNYEKAILIMDLLIKSIPKWTHPYLFKALMLENQNKNEEAIFLYNKILTIDPEESNSINRLKRLKN